MDKCDNEIVIFKLYLIVIYSNIRDDITVYHKWHAGVSVHSFPEVSCCIDYMYKLYQAMGPYQFHFVPQAKQVYYAEPT